MKKIKIMLLLLLLSTMALGAKSDYFTTVELLKNNLKTENVLVLDARGSQKSYLEGHIPGAILVDWTKFSKMNGNAKDEGWGTLDDKGTLQEKLREKGVSNDKKVVVYTDTTSGWGSDGRIAWMLKYAGVKDVKILDGGIVAWKKTEKIAHLPSKVKPSNFIVEFDKNLIIDTKKLSENLEKYNIADTREVAEYNGEKNYGEAKLGRIPTSKSLFFRTLLDENGKIKSKEEVTKVLEAANFDLEKPIVTYCTAGIRSAEAWAVLNAYGYNTINYDESFAGWTSTEGLKVEK